MSRRAWTVPVYPVRVDDSADLGERLWKASYEAFMGTPGPRWVMGHGAWARLRAMERLRHEVWQDEHGGRWLQGLPVLLAEPNTALWRFMAQQGAQLKDPVAVAVPLTKGAMDVLGRFPYAHEFYVEDVNGGQVILGWPDAPGAAV